MNNITPKQKEILRFVKNYSTKNDFAPSLEEIRKKFKLRSVSTIHQHLAALENKGFLQKQKNQPRSITTQMTERMIQIPLRGVIAAGQLHEAIENRETIAVPQNKLPFPNSDYYALRVSGSSMIDENINDGDIVLVKNQNTAQNGEKVIALIDNSEATLKKFYKEKSSIRLEPANKNFEPIIVGKNTPFAIQGVVVNIIKNQTEKFEEKPILLNEQYQTLPLNQIIHGDAVSIMKRLPECSVDLTVTSPPYDEMRNYSGSTFCEFESIVKELYRVTKRGGVVVWVVGDQTIMGNETGTSFKHALYFKEVGFNLFDTMIYLKTPRGAVGNNKTYWQTFEYMFVFSKGTPKTINLIKDRENKEERDGDTGTKRLYDGSLLKQKRAGYSKYGRRTNVWEYLIGKGHSASDKIAYEHPAIFPEKLAQDHIISWSNEGDIVYDPFMGSGTTAKMALLNKRNYIGSEISREYCEIAQKRIKYLRHEMY